MNFHVPSKGTLFRPHSAKTGNSLHPKIILIMKLTAILLTVACLQVSAAAFSQKITISVKNAPLEKVLKAIKVQTGYYFLYNAEVLKQAKPVTIKVEGAELIDVLNECLDGEPFTYEIDNKTILIKFRKEDRSQTKPLPQSRNEDNGHPTAAIDTTQLTPVQGFIRDENQQLLIGATVRVLGKQLQGTTDDKGFYILISVPKDAKIVFSYIGYLSDTVAVNGRRVIDISLKSAVSQLKSVEVVSTGYQTLIKDRATGSFSKPDMSIFSERTGTTDVIARLDGLVPGLVVFPDASSGTAAAGRGTSSVPLNRASGTSNQIANIRGLSSIQLTSQPLYVVNGVEVNDLSTLNPDDIQDVTVLKDASAAAIWGARAANGVIVITTKKGTPNRGLKISYNGYVNFQGKPDFNYGNRHAMTSAQYITALKQTFDPATFPYNSIGTSSGSAIAPPLQILYNQNSGLITAAQATSSLDSLSRIDNREQIRNLWYKNAVSMNHTITASGGTNAYSFYSSLSYNENGSSTIGATNNAYRVNLSQTINPSDRIKISLNTSLNNTLIDNKNSIAIGANFVPFQLFKDANGNNILMDWVQGLSPKTRADYQARSRINLDYSPLDELNYGYSKSNNITINTTADVSVKLFKGLSFNGTYGYQRAPASTIQYTDNAAYVQRNQLLNFTVAPTASSTPVYYLPLAGGKYTDAEFGAKNWTVRNQLVYNLAPRGGKDYLNVQVGQEAQEQVYNSVTTIQEGYNPQLQTYSPINYAQLASGIFGTVGSFRSVFYEVPFQTQETRTRFTSYFGLFDYVFNQKYVLDGSLRIDKSNLFGSEVSAQKKPTYSLGAKWNVSKENFIKSLTWLNDLSLRATYGITGNSPYVGAASSADILSNAVDANTGAYLGISNPANAKLNWEKTQTVNLGADYVILKGRLGGSVDYYSKKTTNLLSTVILNTLTGYQNSLGNLGDLKNNGIELSIRSVNVQSKNFRWSTSLVLSHNTNKLLNYGTAMPDNSANNRFFNAYVAGYPVGALFAYRYAGLDNLGDPQVKLANGTITKNATAATASDLIYKGSTVPTYSGGFTNIFQYQNLTLTANMIYNLGNVMRRTINTFYTGEIGTTPGFNDNLNPDFLNRWQKPGDELKTDIPSYVASSYLSSSRRNVTYYEYADINVTSASYVKLRDITLSYNLPQRLLKYLRISAAHIFVQSGNYMIWKANKYGIDPEYGDAGFPPFTHTYSLGANVSL